MFFDVRLFNRFAHSAGPGIEGSVWQDDARWSSASELGTPSGRAWGALQNQPPQGPKSSPEGPKWRPEGLGGALGGQVCGRLPQVAAQATLRPPMGGSCGPLGVVLKRS